MIKYEEPKIKVQKFDVVHTVDDSTVHGVVAALDENDITTIQLSYNEIIGYNSNSN